MREPTQAKMPATKEAVVSSNARLARDTMHSRKDNEAVAATLGTGWLSLLGVSEHCHVGGWARDHSLRLGDVAFCGVENRKVAFQAAQAAMDHHVDRHSGIKDRSGTGQLHSTAQPYRASQSTSPTR